MQSMFQCLLSSQHDVQAIPILTHGPESVDPSTLPPAIEVVHVRHKIFTRRHIAFNYTLINERSFAARLVLIKLIAIDSGF